MYVFDEVVAVGFNTLCYDAEHSRETAGIKPSARIKDILPIVERELRDEYGFEIAGFRLEELYPLESSYIQPIRSLF